MMDSGDGTKTPPKCSSLSPPLAKASAGVNALAEAFLIGYDQIGEKCRDDSLCKRTKERGLLLDWGWFGKYRENDKEGTALPDRRLDPHAPLMSFHNGFYNRQSQP